VTFDKGSSWREDIRSSITASLELLEVEEELEAQDEKTLGENDVEELEGCVEIFDERLEDDCKEDEETKEEEEDEEVNDDEEDETEDEEKLGARTSITSSST
jgi:hypothetical protein